MLGLMLAALQSLFKGSNQKKLADFLVRDFSQAKHRDAACKNAFVLLGQHRYELAAAFFVLGMLALLSPASAPTMTVIFLHL